MKIGKCDLALVLWDIIYGWLDAFSRYFYYQGRSGRMAFWSFAFLNSIVFFLLFFMDELFGLQPRILIGQYSLGFHLLSSISLLITLIPSFSLCIRRLHDLDYRGWWVLLLIIPIPFFHIGFLCQVIFLIMASLPGTGPNRFGKKPVSQFTV